MLSPCEVATVADDRESEHAPVQSVEPDACECHVAQCVVAPHGVVDEQVQHILDVPGLHVGQNAPPEFLDSVAGVLPVALHGCDCEFGQGTVCDGEPVCDGGPVNDSLEIVSREP